MRTEIKTKRYDNRTRRTSSRRERRGKGKGNLHGNWCESGRCYLNKKEWSRTVVVELDHFKTKNIALVNRVKLKEMAKYSKVYKKPDRSENEVN
jgi:hypothetical protein